jgi:hypothetical protein
MQNNYKNFDWKSYIKQYPDLKNANINTKEKAYLHWNKHGKNEGRIINIKEIENYKTFNWISYVGRYPDLKNANINTKEKAFLHWINHGKNEGRIINDIYNKNAEKQDNIQYNYATFDWKSYVGKYPELQNTNINKEKAFLHWINHGKNEGRIINDIDENVIISNTNVIISNTDILINNNYDIVNIDNNVIIPNADILINNNDDKLIDIKQSKICIIYVYYERNNEQKNQTNLSFFIKYALNKNNWLNLNITCLFVINGHQCEVVIPTESNIHVLKEDNCSDYEGWYNGIKYFEKLNNCEIWQQFDYLCLINASSCGPFIDEDINNHWLIPFYEKMVKDNAMICTPCINYLNKDDAGGPGNRVVPIFSLIKINNNIINLLINTKIINISENSNNTNYPLYNNTIIGKKYDKIDAVLTGEYALSRIFLLNNYNITCLYYENLNEINSDKRIDFYNENNEKLKKTIFIKNNWRWENNYASLPVLYDYCINYINNKLKINNFYKQLDYKKDYSKLLVSNDGINYNDSSKNWNSKEEYYNIYGYSEENIIFPIYTKNNNCVLYAHYDSDNIIKDYVILSINALIILGYDIIFYTASSSINNIDITTLPFTINFYKNEFVGTDWKIWLHSLQNIKNTQKEYEWILLINDSLLFPINGINNFKNTIQTMRNRSDFWGHWDSNEVSWHIIGTPIEFKYALLNDVINFISTSIQECKENFDYISNVETKFSLYLVSKGYKYAVVIPENTLVYTNLHNCPSHNPYIIQQWINNPNSFAIKWKYSISYLDNKNVSPEFNYLTRFLYYGPYGTISSGEKLKVFERSIVFYSDKNNFKYK